MYDLDRTVGFFFTEDNCYLYDSEYAGDFNNSEHCLKTQFDDDGITKVLSDEEIKPGQVINFIEKLISNESYSTDNLETNGDPDTHIIYRYIGNRYIIFAKLNLQTGSYDVMRVQGAKTTSKAPLWFIEMFHNKEFDKFLSNEFFKQFPEYKKASKIS